MTSFLSRLVVVDLFGRFWSANTPGATTRILLISYRTTALVKMSETWMTTTMGPPPDLRAESAGPEDGQTLPKLLDFDVLRFHAWSIVAVVVAIVGGFVAFSSRQVPVYEAKAEVLVKSITQPAKKVELNMETERKIAGSLGVAAVAAQKLETEDPETLLRGLSVNADGDTPVLELIYSSEDPTLASRSVQALAEAYLDYRRQQFVEDLASSARRLEQQLRVLRQQLASVNQRVSATANEASRTLLLGQANSLTGQIAVLEQELVGTVPPDNLPMGEILQPPAVSSAPAKLLRQGAIALFVALGLGIGQALVRELVAGRAHKPGDLEAALGAPLLGTLPRPEGLPRRTGRAGIVLASEDHAGTAGAFRRLRVALLLAAESYGAKTIGVTDAADKDGRAFVTANLSAAVAGSGRRTTVVSTQTGEGSVEDVLAVDRRSPGLADVLLQRLPVDEAFAPTGVEDLLLVPAGSRPQGRASADLLGSAEMEKVLRELSASADLVLVDMGPVLESVDAVTLAPVVDGVVVVVSARGAVRTMLEEVRHQLERVNARLIGIILDEG